MPHADVTPVAGANFSLARITTKDRLILLTDDGLRHRVGGRVTPRLDVNAADVSRTAAPRVASTDAALSGRDGGAVKARTIFMCDAYD